MEKSIKILGRAIVCRGQREELELRSQGCLFRRSVGITGDLVPEAKLIIYIT